MSKKVIGLNGVARAGKDEIGKRLTSEHGYNRVSFADGVREALYKLNPIIPNNDNTEFRRVQELVDELGYDVVKTDYTEVRELLQRMGTEVGRDMFGEDCWIRLAERKINDLEKIVITDVRFDNERQFVQGLSKEAYVLQVFRPGYGSVNSHVSDVMLCSEVTDGAIYNDGSIEELKQSVDAVVGEYNL